MFRRCNPEIAQVDSQQLTISYAMLEALGRYSLAFWDMYFVHVLDAFMFHFWNALIYQLILPSANRDLDADMDIEGVIFC